ncbi:hypothetical protein SteCoe_34367 [Stentor coeruleus]|uniref:Uncharacterized protein n=1 Tax=Stentor coeruleus TaxID=5963 RepID=A0A1R2AV08_9CILI|nr:hypothetical protein SteCoe_34367 [Stentor coeruleus]
MYDNEIYTLKLDFFNTKPTKKKLVLNETHKMLKNPSFTELNKMINEYPQSPPDISVYIRPTSAITKKSQVTSSTSRERCARTPEDYLKECTFRPKISQPINPENKNVPFEKKLQILSKSKRDIIEKREKEKLKKEIEEAASFPYTPEISNYNFKSKIPLEKRILQQVNKYDEREKLKRQQDIEKEKECTFHPKISKKSNEKTLPFHERIDQIQIEKLRNYGKLRQKHEIDMSFKPQINDHSRALSTKRKTSTDIGSESTKKCISHTESSKELQFSDISPLRLPTKEYHNHNDFLNRQDQHINRKNTNIKHRQQAEDNSLNFTPLINKQSSIIVDTTSSPKTIISKMRQMSDSNLFKLQKQKEIREAFYAKFSFIPEINQVSQKIGRNSSIEMLTENSCKKKIIDKKIEDINEDMIGNCTFSPEVNVKKQFKYVKSGYSQNVEVMKKIHEEVCQKKQKNDEIKFAKDFEEIKNCSFKPEVNKSPMKNEKKVQVKGIERYLELKQMANNANSDKEIKSVRAVKYSGSNKKSDVTTR